MKGYKTITKNALSKPGLELLPRSLVSDQKS
ncbi:MAG: hypothetical protein JWP81_3024 [Ferruginibacter sp.]|nr:hypothetical protein [Ferruginibacter sp.]